MDVSGRSYNNGARIHLWEDHAMDNQSWYIDGQALKNARSRKYLDVPGRDAHAGQYLQQWDCNVTDSQKWEIK